MPSYRHHEMGDLHVHIKVKFPDTIDPSVIPALESALPPRQIPAPPAKNLHVDEVTLEEPNDRQRRTAANGASDEMDEDDDERPGVQCAQQ